MRNLFHKRGHNGRLTITSIPATRHERWRAQFDAARGPYFYAAALLAAAGFYCLLVTAMALF